MIDTASTSLAERLSTWRSIDPPGVLPHLARVLDARTPATESEAEIDVELLAVDATSYQTIRTHSDGDPQRMARVINEVVAERGKLQNPWTGSGGVLMGRVCDVGRAYHASDLKPGGLVMPLASLIAIPLRLESVGPVNPASPQVPVRGRAVVTGSMACIAVPEDLPARLAVAAFDVYPVASYVRDMAGPGTHVLICGAGHAGLLALAAAREAVGHDGLVTILDQSTAALDRAQAVDALARCVAADVTDTVTSANSLTEQGLPRGDLTLLCTTVPGAEGTAIAATDEHGTILFFSTATSFAAAGLGADAAGSQAKLIIPNGLTEDRGEYAFELIRRHPRLRQVFEATT